MTRDAFGMIEVYGLETADRFAMDVGLVSGHMIPGTGWASYSNRNNSTEGEREALTVVICHEVPEIKVSVHLSYVQLSVMLWTTRRSDLHKKIVVIRYQSQIVKDNMPSARNDNRSPSFAGAHSMHGEVRLGDGCILVPVHRFGDTRNRCRDRRDHSPPTVSQTIQQTCGGMLGRRLRGEMRGNTSNHLGAPASQSKAWMVRQ